MVCSFRKLQVERVSRYGAGLQKSIYCFMVQKDFQKDTINCKGNVMIFALYCCKCVVKFRMLLIFSNDFCYLYYELKMRKHGWNRMLNCAFTKKLAFTVGQIWQLPILPQCHKAHKTKNDTTDYVCISLCQCIDSSEKLTFE